MNRSNVLTGTVPMIFSPPPFPPNLFCMIKRSRLCPPCPNISVKLHHLHAPRSPHSINGNFIPPNFCCLTHPYHPNFTEFRNFYSIFASYFTKLSYLCTVFLKETRLNCSNSLLNHHLEKEETSKTSNRIWSSHQECVSP